MRSRSIEWNDAHDRRHNESTKKTPEVSLGFWIIKILATTLGETGGDAVTMTLGVGYLVGTAIFFALLVIAVSAQIKATRFHQFLYWAVIITTTTAGTTLADLFDRSLGIGYVGGSSILLVLVLGRSSFGTGCSARSPSPRWSRLSSTLAICGGLSGRR